MKSNLPYQDVSCCIFNEDVSFQSIIKGRVSSRGAGGADPRVLRQKPGQHDSVTSSESFAAICWKNFANDHNTPTNSKHIVCSVFFFLFKLNSQIFTDS